MAVRSHANWLTWIGIGLIGLVILGCSLGGPDRGGVGAPPADPVVEPSARAEVSFSFQVTASAAATPLAAVRAAATDSASVLCRLLSLDRTNPAAPTTAFQQVVAVPPDGIISVTFSQVPARTAIAQVEVFHAEISGFTSFHGALDLVAGPNRVVVNPTGSGLRHDLVAHMLEAAAVSPTVCARLPADAAAVAANLVGTLDRHSASLQEDAVRAFTRFLNPPRWRLSAEAVRAAQIQLLGVSGPGVASSALWTPGETFVTENLPQDEVAGLCGAGAPGAALPVDGSLPRFSVRADAALPRRLDWRDRNGRNWLSPVRNQFPYSTCVAFSCCGALEAMMQIQANAAPVDLSEWFLFRQGTRGDLGQLNRGWDLRSGCDQLQRFGVVAEDWQPYHLIPRFSEPPAGARVYRADGYRLAQGALAMKQALQEGPIVSGMRVYEDFMRYTGGVYWHATGREVGFHAILVVGYDDDEDCWICKNSWSAAWGEAGFFRIRQGQLQDSGYALRFAFTTAAPASPAGVQATAGDRTVILSWPDVAGATAYHVYWSASPGVVRGQGVRVQNVVSPWRHPGLTNDRAYHYVVTAENQTGESRESAEVAATPTARRTIPGNLAATAGDRQVTLTWDAPPLPASSYNLYWSTSAADVRAGTRITRVTSPFVHLDRLNGVPVHYVVTAVVDGVESEPTAAVAAIPGLVPPSSVTAVALDRAVRLTWDPVPGAQGYQLYVATAPGVVPGASTRVPGVGSPYLHTGLRNGIDYWFRLTATIGAVESAASAEVVARPLISAPTGLAATVGGGVVRVSWNPVAGASGYRLYWTDQVGMPAREGRAVGGANSPYLHAGARPWDNYSYTVTAVDAAGESAPAPEVAVTFTNTSVAGLRVIDGASLELTFTDALDERDAAVTANYTLSGGGRGTLAVNPSGVMRVSERVVRLVWASGEMVAGDVTVTVAATVRDTLGNLLGAVRSGTAAVGAGGSGPTVSAVRVSGARQIDVTFSEPVTVADARVAANYQLSGPGRGTLAAAPSAVASLSPAVWRLTWTTGEMLTGGDVTVTVASGVRDLAGNPMGPVRSGMHAGGGVGGVAPTVVVNRAANQADPTNAATVLFTAIFSEPVLGLTADGVLLGGAARPTGAVVRRIAPDDGTAWEIAVSGMSADGPITAAIGPGCATDLAGNPNLASTNADNVIVRDTRGMDVTSLQVIDGRHVDVGFSKPPNPVDVTVVANFTFTGPGRGTLATAPTTAIPGAGNLVRLGWAAGEMMNGGDLTVTVAAGVRDQTGNPMGPGRSVTRVGAGVGGESPRVTVNQRSGQADPSDAPTIEFLAVFSEPVFGFGTAAVAMGGAAGPTTVAVTEVAPFDRTTWVIAVSGMTTGGAVTAAIRAGVCVDAAGNANLPSTSSDNVVTFDPLSPRVTAVTVVGGRSVEVAYNVPMNAGDLMAVANYAVSGVGRGSLATQPGEIAWLAANRVRLGWAAGEMRQGGDLTVTVSGSMRDDTGRLIGSWRSGTHVGGGLGVAPTASLAPAVGQLDPAGVLPVRFALTFSERVVGLTAGDVSLGGSAAPTAVTVNESAPFDGTVWELVVTGTTGDGAITVGLPAGRVTDLAGNPNQAATSGDDTVAFDSVPPTVTLVEVIDTHHVDVTFSVPMNSAEVGVAANYTLSGTGRGTLAAQPASVVARPGTTWRLAWTGGEMAPGGDITVTVASSVRNLLGVALGLPRSQTHVAGGIGLRPRVTGIVTRAANLAEITFSEALEGSVTDPANYTIAGGRGTLAANPDRVVALGGTTWLLEWNSGAMWASSSVTVSVANVEDPDGNPLEWPPSASGPTRMFDLDFVTVGDAGNAADTNGYGAVAAPYQIGRFEVTNAQFAAFLNAVAASDPYGLYSPSMSPAVTSNRGGIQRNGVSGSYTYSVAANMGNKPVNWVSYYGVIRFINWLHNGGHRFAGTETGAYPITGGGNNAGTVGARSAGARFALPGEHAWYKAAFYKGGGLAAGYWGFAIVADSFSGWVLANSIGDSLLTGGARANFGNHAVWNGLTGHVVGVGTAEVPGPYGTFDQSGNVREWIEGGVIRGGDYSGEAWQCSRSARTVGTLSTRESTLGFRVGR